MKKYHTLLLASIAVAGLAGCAGSPDSQQLSQRTVEYACGPGGQQPLTVQYTFRGDEAISARVIHMNQTVEMARVTAGNADMVGNTFRGGGYAWTTGKFDRDDVDEVHGDMLTQDAVAGTAAAGTGAGYQAGVQPGMPAGQGGLHGAGYGAQAGMPAPQGAPAATYGAPAGATAGSTGAVGNILLRDCRVR